MDGSMDRWTDRLTDGWMDREIGQIETDRDRSRQIETDRDR